MVIIKFVFWLQTAILNLKFLLSYTIFVSVQSVYISYLYIDNLRYAMHFLHRSESTDSLLAWSPLECERNKYAQRYFLSTTSKQRKLQPTLLDRTVLDRTFRRLEGNQSTDCEKEPAETTSGYRAKNVRRKSAIKAMRKNLITYTHVFTIVSIVFETKLLNKHCEKTDYEVQICREYKRFEREFITLRVDSVRMLSCSGDRQTDDGWGLIADRVQEYLIRIREFFDSKLSHINSMESTWTLRRRTLALEVLKKLYVRDVSRMDDWIESVVESPPIVGLPIATATQHPHTVDPQRDGVHLDFKTPDSHFRSIKKIKKLYACDVSRVDDWILLICNSFTQTTNSCIIWLF
ncbi:hypothetical protein QTP88_014523 [Uroleucon formosanum]